MNGRLISLEGGEGVGKSTQARLLATALAERGVEAIITREPGGTAGAEAIRALLLNTGGEGWHARAEALLFAAARSDHVARRIRPALARGAWVICDRFIDSSRAYQAGHDGLSDADVLALHRVGSLGLMPDRTVLLTLPAAVAAQRLADRDGGAADRIGGRDAAYHAQVAAAFAALAAAEPARIAPIDAQGAPDVVHRRIMAALAGMLPP